MTSLHFFCLNAQPQGCYHCSKEHKFPTNGFKSQMSRPTGRNDQKPLARADFLRQIPLLCPALPLCDLTLIGALLIRGIRRSSDNAATRSKLPITPTDLNEIRKQLTLTDSFDATFWAACLVAFYSFFRKANLLLLSRDKFVEH